MDHSLTTIIHAFTVGHRLACFLTQKSLDSPVFGDSLHVERVKKASKENAQAQVQEAAQTPKILTS
jgi:hypothetical protein